MHPPFSFPSCGKENGPCTVQKKRPLGRTPVQRPSVRTGVGVSVPAPILPDLRARYALLRFLSLPSRGGWCRPRRGGCRIELLLFYPQGVRRIRKRQSRQRLRSRCRSRSRAEEPAAAKIGAGCILLPPRAKGFPKGRAFPSLTAARERQPSPAGGRRSAPAQTDPPKRSFLLDRARPVFFSARPKRKWGVHCPAINIADFPTQTGGLPFTAR